MEKKMATVSKAKELIEELCSASWSSAIQGNVLLSWFVKNFMEFGYMIVLGFFPPSLKRISEL